MGGKEGNTRDTIRQALPGIILWHIWKAYNAYIWDGKQFSKSQTISQIKDYTTKWIYANQHKSCINFDKEIHSDGLMPIIHKKKSKSQFLKWKTSSPPQLILNTDAAFRNAKSAGGAILRNELGILQRAYAFPLTASNPLHAETLASISSIHTLITQGYTSFKVHTDSEILVKTINGFATIPDYLKSAIRTLYWLRTAHNLSISYRPRETNRVAHHLAQLGLTSDNLQTFTADDLPPRAKRAYNEDRAGVAYFRDAG
ncbi:unnamed protein product [Cuscuta epithymum]|uniref:RNase H type-1 domain-containing protein n=1 Tax=Cuscuta epithymum TaxID=186058 RepID=A0AAV0E9R4_9ASTE|nr:unnamed protein product [Cuscuta epithymum]